MRLPLRSQLVVEHANLLGRQEDAQTDYTPADKRLPACLLIMFGDTPVARLVGSAHARFNKRDVQFRALTEAELSLPKVEVREEVTVVLPNQSLCTVPLSSLGYYLEPCREMRMRAN